MSNFSSAETRNISWLFFDRIIRLFGGLFVGIWVARYLGPNDFGILNYALAYTGLFVVFVNLGLDQIIVREIVKKPKLTNYLLGTGFFIKFVGAFVSIVFTYISLHFIDVDGLTKLVIIILSTRFLFQALDMIDYFYQSAVLSKYVVIARNFAFIVGILLQIYFIVHQYSVVYFAIALVVEAFISGVLLVVVYKNSSHSLIIWRFSTRISLQLLKYSWPLGLSIFLISIYTRIDQVMIGSMLDSKQVGIYSAAVRLSEAWLFLPTLVITTFLPYFVKIKSKDIDKYYRQLLQLYSFIFWLGVVVSVVVVFFGYGLIEALFGKAYVNAYDALVFNVWAGIAMSHAGARGIWLINENLQLYRLYNNIIAVILNILLNVILIPVMGIAGAALSTLITQSLGTWFLGLLWKPTRSSTLSLVKSFHPKYLFVDKSDSQI